MRAIFTSFLCTACGFLVGFAGAYWGGIGETHEPVHSPDQRGERDSYSHASDKFTTSEQRIDSCLDLMEKPRDDARDLALYTALQSLNAAELKLAAPGMLEAIKRLGAKQSFATLVGEAWMDRWLEVDAPSALEFLSGSRILDEMDPKGEWKEFGGMYHLTFEGVFRAVARRHPEWTRSYLAKLKPDARRNAGVYLLSAAVARTDPTRAKQFIAEFLSGENRRFAFEGYVVGLAQRSPSDAFQAALGEPGGPFRDNLMDRVFWEASVNGTGTIRQLLDLVQDPTTRQNLTGRAIGNLAHRTRENILPWLKEELERSGATSKSEYNFGWNWALQEAMQIQDHPESADWTLSMPSDVGRTALQQVTSSWVRSDPEAMKAWLSKHSQRMDGETIGHLKYALTELVKHDVSSAATWAESLPAGALRDSIQIQAATAQAKTGSIDEMRSIYARLAARDSNGDMAKLVATTLAESRGEDAASWAENLPTGAARTAALRSVAAEWGQRDPIATAEWLRELPAGKDRDGSIADYTSKISCAEPVAAAQWVSEISDRSERENAAAQVYFTWAQENPGAAAAWVKQLSGVSDTWRRETLRPRL